MSDTGLLDQLNRSIRFGPDGSIVWIDRPAALAVLEKMRHRPVAGELKRCIDTGSFSGNRLISVSDYREDSGLMVALMSTPYVRDADDHRVICLHGFEFTDIGPTGALRAAFPAPDVRPVSVTAATAHMRDTLRFVAFFPDSILGTLPEGYEDGFYFREKFVEAFETRIRPLLDTLWTDDSFAALRAAAPEDLRMAAAIWVHLHEHFHCSADLPVAVHPVLKGTRLAGAFEELRVDLSAMLAGIDGLVGPELARITFEFILAFRLIYYGSSFDPARDYDAVTSVALGTALLDAGAVGPDGAAAYCLATGEMLRAPLRNLLDRLSEAETRTAAALSGGAGDDRQVLYLRSGFENLMRDLCAAGDHPVIRRASFHARHAAVLDPAPVALVPAQ